MFTKVLIANRGEVALRIVRACRDLGVTSVVAYSSADRDSLAVELADERVCIGPPPAASYTNVPAILYAAARSGADAVHPGYGFLSEDAAFAEACTQSGIVFIGPSSAQIALMGDKIRARTAMAAAGVPVLPGSDGALGALEEAADVASRVGYPVVLKASAGGGGRGIAVVNGPLQLEPAWNSVRRTALTLFGSDKVYLEKYAQAASHIEAQVLADSFGTVLHLGERDCSVQRRHQKLVEEAPVPGLPEATRAMLVDAALAGARSIGYVSAGTFEFLVDEGGQPWFIEMNTRLQVEHTVTELCTGIDIVAWMIRIAAGEPLTLSQGDLRQRGHAIEARINAEDPARDWATSCGRVSGLRLPSGPGVRVDSHLFDGYFVPPYYDSLLAKIVTYGATRDEAMRRMSRALAEVRCEGLTTNTDFHRALVEHPSFQDGSYRLGIADEVVVSQFGAEALAC